MTVRISLEHMILFGVKHIGFTRSKISIVLLFYCGLPARHKVVHWLKRQICSNVSTHFVIHFCFFGNLLIAGGIICAAHKRGTAEHGGFFNNDYRSTLFCSGKGSGKAGSAAAYYNDISRFFNFVAFGNLDRSLHETLGINTGSRKRVQNGIQQTVAAERATRDCIQR